MLKAQNLPMLRMTFMKGGVYASSSMLAMNPQQIYHLSITKHIAIYDNYQQAEGYIDDINVDFVPLA